LVERWIDGLMGKQVNHQSNKSSIYQFFIFFVS
jgi:hypothetical protein